MTQLVLISRKEAIEQTGHSDRARNYELEHSLERLHDQSLIPGNTQKIEYIISEWCPFNGIHCAYFEHATECDLVTAYTNITAAIEEGYMAKHAADKVKERLDEVRAESYCL